LEREQKSLFGLPFFAILFTKKKVSCPLNSAGLAEMA